MLAWEISHKNLLSNPAKSFVAAPALPVESLVPDPTRKKRIVDWLCQNIQHLNELSQISFDSLELGRLHQHYFAPVVNECGGDSTGYADHGGDSTERIVNSVPEVSRAIAVENHTSVTPSTQSIEDHMVVPVSDPSLPASPQGAGGTSLPMLKRKVSYRFLGDAVVSSRQSNLSNHNMNGAVAKMIEDGGVGHSMPPKTKRARRNKTRISFLPRVKARLDSYLDVCHEKALILMRQLYFIEASQLKGIINARDPAHPTTHLAGVLASEAEMILIDMM